MKLLEDFSQPEDIILDCFRGSGTTIIACELTGRTCLMMELNPEYCDTIIDRCSYISRDAKHARKHDNIYEEVREEVQSAITQALKQNEKEYVNNDLSV